MRLIDNHKCELAEKPWINDDITEEVHGPYVHLYDGPIQLYQMDFDQMFNILQIETFDGFLDFGKGLVSSSASIFVFSTQVTLICPLWTSCRIHS